jgi:hypothetical protein
MSSTKQNNNRGHSRRSYFANKKAFSESTRDLALSPVGLLGFRFTGAKSLSVATVLPVAVHNPIGESREPLEGLNGFRIGLGERGEKRKHVHHAWCNMKLHVDAESARTTGEPHHLIVQAFAVPDLDQKRRKAGEVNVARRCRS